MTRLVRPPSVEDYARMTQAARLSAARLIEDRNRLIAEHRASLRTAGQHRTGQLVRGAAQLILDTLPAESPDVALDRQRVLEEALDAYADPRTRRVA